MSDGKASEWRLLPPARDGCTYLQWSLLRERLASPTRKQTEDAIQRNPARLTRSPVLRLPLWVQPLLAIRRALRCLPVRTRQPPRPPDAVHHGWGPRTT